MLPLMRFPPVMSMRLGMVPSLQEFIQVFMRDFEMGIKFEGWT